jgi:alcohol dehydrogenase, propanol-preferring
MQPQALPATMRAIVFEGVGRPLREIERDVPRPDPGQLLLAVSACGICRTDLHLLDGEVEVAAPPRVLGHQIVGTVVARGSPAAAESGVPGVGERVGVPWLGWSCGECAYCRSGRENLCALARFTGCDLDGGMAEFAVANERYCFAIREGFADEQAAPLLCAGLISYRALKMCGSAHALGLYGFGAAAHILAQVAVHEGREVYAFTREDDVDAQVFAMELGAMWAGPSTEPPPVALDAAIIFAPDGALVPLALKALARGGTVVCGGIHMSDIPSLQYSDLWQERAIRSVANLTRADAREFLALAPTVPVRTTVTTYPLSAAAQALEDLRAGRFTGAAVLVP